MLSGSLPRGSSRTPLKGKIGRVSGNSGMAGSGASPGIAALAEEQRGEAPPRRDGQRIGRTHGLEELDELLAPGLLVPLAVEPHQLEQLVDRLLAAAAGEERAGELEPRLVILGVLRQARAQLVGG